MPIDCDVSQRDQVDRAVAAAVEAFGPIDILVNNAQAIPQRKPLQEWSEDDMNLMWATGPMGTWHFMVACLPHMKNRDGRIINTCSGAGHGYLCERVLDARRHLGIDVAREQSVALEASQRRR